MSKDAESFLEDIFERLEDIRGFIASDRMDLQEVESELLEMGYDIADFLGIETEPVDINEF